MSGLRIGSLFSGVGGLDLAVEAFFGGTTAWHCEWEAEPSKVLAAHWPGVPNFGDVTAVDWSNVEPVDIICGGFPCQDLSLAGRRSGMRPGTRSGLWADFRKAIAVLRPSVVLIENVRGLLSGCAESESDSELGPCPRCADPESGVQHAPNLRALGRVLIDLAALGFDAEWHALPASDVGAPHGRFRVFVLAYARGVRLGSRWDSVPGEAAGGRASAVACGPADAPLTLLPTPVAQPSGNTPENHLRKKPGRSVVTDLAILVENDLMKSGGRLLPTPTASEAEKGGPNQAHGGGDRTLSGVAPMLRLLPTPTARDEAGSGGSNASNVTLTDAVVRTNLGSRENARLLPTPTTAPETGNGHARNLGKEAKLLPTPQVADMQGGHASRSGERSDELLLPGVAVAAQEGRLLPTPRAARGASGTETMYALGAERDDSGDRQGNVVGSVAWGEYEPVVRRWEAITRPAPAPTLPDGKNGNHRLAAVFPEWMMGYPAGWVTDVIGRNPAIKACGNGVVPQQAYAALGVVWPYVRDAVAA